MASVVAMGSLNSYRKRKISSRKKEVRNIWAEERATRAAATSARATIARNTAAAKEEVRLKNEQVDPVA